MGAMSMEQLGDQLRIVAATLPIDLFDDQLGVTVQQQLPDSRR
jgi:hypothetical protein